MKKALAWTLAIIMMLMVSISALAEEPADDGMGGGTTIIESVPIVEDAVGLQEGSMLTIGNTTAISGYLATDMWGTNTADMDVRALLQGYSVVAMTRTHGLAIDGMAIASITTEVVPEGRTYVINIMEDLTYNDGTPITAKDYVFSALLSGASQVYDLGGTPRGMSHIIGFDEYLSGESEALLGVRLLSEYSFSLTISGYFLPYFYGLAMLNITPFPLHVIAPGCDIADDGEGAYITAGPDAADMDAEALGFTPGVFDTQMLQKTMLDPETGYVFYPYVSSGPYSLEGYDMETKEVSMVVNPYYLGNYEGKKPHIERLVMKYVTNDTMADMLASGEVDIINKVIDSETIEQITAMVNQEDSGLRSSSYPRTGLAFLAFACEDGPTASANVRRAIAMAVPKQELVDQTVGRYGIVVNAYYGLGQWMVGQTMPEDTENDLPAVDVPVAMEGWATAYDLDEAADLLAADGWTLDETGAPYVARDGAIRHRENEAGELEPLTIKWARSSDSSVASVLQGMLEVSFARLGIDLQVTEIPFSDLLMHYYRIEERTYDMFYLASNFAYLFDPYYDFNAGDEYQGLVNTSGLQDEELMNLARAMRETPPSEMQRYLLRWIDFQNRFVELMPLVPLYSSTYFDFYRNTIQDYNITQHAGWAYAIQYAWIGEPTEETDLETVPLQDEASEGLVRVIDGAGEAEAQ